MDQPIHPLREYRARTGVKLAQLAAAVFTSKTTLSEIENGKRPVSLELLPKLSRETGISPERLRPDLAELMTNGEAAA